MSGEPNATKVSTPFRRRIRVWAIACAFYGVALALAVAGFVVLRHAFAHGLDPTDRQFTLVGSATLLALPALICWLHIRSKLTTGRWFGTTEEGRQRVAQCVMRPQRNITREQRSLVLFLLHWANISIRDPQSSIFKRLTGVLVVIAYATVLLAICALSVILVGAGVATFASLGWLMALFGLVLLFIPAQFVIALIRRRRVQGNLCSSPDDLASIRAARNRWFQQQRQQSIRAKLISTAIGAIVLTGWWLRVTVYHFRHTHESWTSPLVWTLFALYLTWNQFRRPKSSPEN